MNGESVSARAKELIFLLSPLVRFFEQMERITSSGDPGVCDFTFGNPHEPVLPEFVNILRAHSVPGDENWYAYKRNEHLPRSVIAESLSRSHGQPFGPEDVFLTNGAIAALAVIADLIIDPGDELIFFTPPWPLYEPIIRKAGGTPVKLKLKPGTFDLDLEAVAEAISEKTRAIIINSPHNPTGRIYQPRQLEELAAMLSHAGEKYGRKLYLISDEAYRKIIFDGRPYHSPAVFYPDTFIVYTYGKTLLTPGQRIGYIALPPSMTGRDRLREALPVVQMVNGWSFPNALLMHALRDLENLSIDIAHLQAKRDRLIRALGDMGYEVDAPEATFYALVKSPGEDDWAFAEMLASRNVFCLPGSLVEAPGYFRISLTATDEMIDRALPVFSSALRSDIGRVKEGA
jgi:aspartate aminotransferase